MEKVKGNIEVKEAQATFDGVCVTEFTVRHTSAQGGDAGWGCFAEIAIKNKFNTYMEAAITVDGKPESELISCNGIKFRLSGDGERVQLMKGLEFILAELRTMGDIPNERPPEGE